MNVSEEAETAQHLNEQLPDFNVTHCRVPTDFRKHLNLESAWSSDDSHVTCARDSAAATTLRNAQPTGTVRRRGTQRLSFEPSEHARWNRMRPRRGALNIAAGHQNVELINGQASHQL